MELFRFEENEDGATLVEFLARGDETVTEVEIPDTYQGKPVTRIGERVFSYCHYLKKVKFPKSLVRLDDEIFMTCPALESVEFPEKVMQNESVTFGKQVFSGCQKLPAETILMGALGACSLDTPMTQKRLNENIGDILRADVLQLALEHHVLDKVNHFAMVKYMKGLDLADRLAIVRDAGWDTSIDYEVLKDFHKTSDVPQELIDEYVKKVPRELEVIRLWREYGFGSFFHDYFRLINPHDYEDFVAESFNSDSIPLMLTPFGDIVIYDTKFRCLYVLMYRYKDFTAIPSGFYDTLKEEFFLKDKKIQVALYEKAVEKCGALAGDECFGFVKMPREGGSNSVKNLHKVKTKEYLAWIVKKYGKFE